MNIDDRIALWDAINAVVAASGGDTGNTSVARQKAVVLVDGVVDRMVARRGWVCIRHRCAKHYDVPAQNTNEASGAECGCDEEPGRCPDCGEAGPCRPDCRAGAEQRGSACGPGCGWCGACS